jgi:GAF domain-containing protein
MPSETPTTSADQSVEELRRELAEAREQQAATSEILRVLSGSPTDLQRVFTEIAAGAARLCDAYDGGILQVVGDHWRIVAHHGPIPITAQGALTRGLPTGRAILDRHTLHIADLQAETDEFPEGSEFDHRLGYRTILCVPLLRAGEAIGVIFVRRTTVRPFTIRQIDLLKTFADQWQLEARCQPSVCVVPSTRTTVRRFCAVMPHSLLICAPLPVPRGTNATLARSRST